MYHFTTIIILKGCIIELNYTNQTCNLQKKKIKEVDFQNIYSVTFKWIEVRNTFNAFVLPRTPIDVDIYTTKHTKCWLFDFLSVPFWMFSPEYFPSECFFWSNVSFCTISFGHAINILVETAWQRDSQQQRGVYCIHVSEQLSGHPFFIWHSRCDGQDSNTINFGASIIS